jgi:alpha-L-arabinofuranosidase
LDLDVVSLFPENTWKHRRNGLRADLVQRLADLHPAFMRFPGGCIVEGMDLPNRYQWKDTIGDIAERPENWNRWQDAMGDATAPQYYQTYGLGFFEYFQLCEDLGAEPVPILNCGMACQYESKQLVPLDQLGPFVQDALDLIEFANGPVTSPWGARRAAMGHPEPFHLKIVGVGNEQWGEQYFERYTIVQAALKAKHPEIQFVTGAGPGVDDGFWKLAWDKFMNGTPADIIDEHYYRPPQWFLENATRYDAQERRGPKVFAGEFAAHDGPQHRPTLRAAVAEAAFMTGLLRNSDLVAMSSYAPLFAKAGASQWAPDLIWFDNTRVYGTPSYYVQALYSRNRPDVILPVAIDGPPVILPALAAASVATYGAPPRPPYRSGPLPALFVAAGWDRQAGEVVLFVANPYAEARDATVALGGASHAATAGKVIVLASTTPDDVNSFEAPATVAPREEKLNVGGPEFSYRFSASSFTVLRLKMAK